MEPGLTIDAVCQLVLEQLERCPDNRLIGNRAELFRQLAPSGCSRRMFYRALKRLRRHNRTTLRRRRPIDNHAGYRQFEVALAA